MNKKKPLVKRLWAKVQIPETPDSCWLWTAHVNTSGYGQISDDNGKLKLASRIIYEIYNGAIPDGLLVLHTCDNPQCVNPNHLFVGTQFDNMRDMMKKGRGVMRKGHARHPRRKVSKEDIGRIKQLYKEGMYQKDIAILFAIHQASVSRIVLDKNPIID